MKEPHGRLLQVVLTGARRASCSDAELLARLQSRFKLTPAQSAAMLKGRCVVKRGIDGPSARRLIIMLGELGLEAIVENQAAPPTTAPKSAVAAPAAKSARPAAVAKPASRQVPAPRRRADPLEALQALADKRLPNPPASPAYRAGLLVVTLLCVALPATYIGLTAAIAFGWFFYLTHIHHHLPHNIQLVALLYAVPGLAGAMLLVFLVRPLFAPRPRPMEVLKLDPKREAAFVSGVRALCRSIGVSPPIEIRLSWDANASVQFRTPWLSLFTGHKVLTIGLSLVGGLSARQFVGVLAHEFGHFAQRFGMICTFTVNSVNAWLEHCAFGEDAWHRKLRDWSAEAVEAHHWFSWIVSLSVTVSWMAIGLTRRLMGMLFHMSLRLSRYMSRQMEFDADRYEALLAGSDSFGTTARSIRALNHAFVEVNQANINAWQEQRLLRDLPEAVAAHARDFDAARLTKIEEEMRDQTTTRYWDSHPPDVERIDNARKQQFAGIYHEESSAALLLKDFSGWSQRATQLFYAEQGVQFTSDQLRSREEILGHVRHRSQQREQLNRFFNGQFQDWPLFQAGLQQGIDPAQLGWQECIDRIRALSPEIARHWLQAFQAHQRRPLLRTAVKLGASSRQLGLSGADRSPEELNIELSTIAGGRTTYTESLEEAFGFYAVRIEHAIQAMSAAEREHASKLRDTLVGLSALEREASSLEELAGAIQNFCSIAETSRAMPPGFPELEVKFSDDASLLLGRADRIAQTVTEGGTAGAYLRSCCRDLPPPGINVQASVLARALWPVPGAFHHLYLLVLGELVCLCEAAEKGNGIRPIRLVA